MEIELNTIESQQEIQQSRGIAESGASEEEIRSNIVRLEGKALWVLSAQHLSKYVLNAPFTRRDLMQNSTWGDRTAEFAFYLYLIQLFQSTLLPASLFGFFTTGTAIFLSGTVGRLVDRIEKLKYVRACIIIQRASATCAYGLFFLFFEKKQLLREAAEGKRAPAHIWILFAAIILLGSILKLSTIGISVAIERDWASSIADGNSDRLNTINTMIRRIDLSSKLLGPLFVSLLTTVASYPFSIGFLGLFGVIAGLFEFWC